MQAYLEALGGTVEGETVFGKGWQARLKKMEPYRIGSLSIGRVKLLLEGNEPVVSSLLEKLELKTFRGGG
jgi:hypothetical protein